MKMYRISEEDSKNLRKEMKKAKNILAYRKMEAVALRGEGKKNEEIGEITGFHPDMVGRLAKEYLEGGIAGLLYDGRKGGNHRNASDSEEEAFIELNSREPHRKAKLFRSIKSLRHMTNVSGKRTNRNPRCIIYYTNWDSEKSCPEANTRTAQPQRQ
jgi:transposase